MMTDTAYEGMFRRHNLAATFDGRRKAQQAADVLTPQPAGLGCRGQGQSRRPRRSVREMRDELEGLVALLRHWGPRSPSRRRREPAGELCSWPASVW